jgi:putative (di)nucleoside polyphosphate hydrolase
MRAVKKPYRPNVAAILQRSDGKILIARRSDYPESWQFPQGGVGKGESAEEALRREVFEEVALPPETYLIEADRGGYCYEFPSGPDRRGFHGQEQHYFLCRLDSGAESKIDPKRGCGEFTECQWVEVNNFPHNLVPPMKQEVYRRVLRDFFGPEVECH